MSLNFPVTLVIPILNEAESLPELLLALEAQSHRPNEIIFVDAGSTDGSSDVIGDWWRRKGWGNAKCVVLSKSGAMPGAGRNAGVSAATNEWIAFIDGGITPSYDWLEQLCLYALKKNVNSVFGLCNFAARTPFSRAVCALSYGYGTEHAVLPASLFAKKVFIEVGLFPDQLRAGEDLVWMAALKDKYGRHEICSSARVSYTHFPNEWVKVITKWRDSEFYCVIAGVRRGQQSLYLIGIPLIYFFLMHGETWGGVAYAGYVFMRGFIDPIRKSRVMPWWTSSVKSVFIALPLACVIDCAKWYGIVEGINCRIFSRLRAK